MEQDFRTTGIYLKNRIADRLIIRWCEKSYDYILMPNEESYTVPWQKCVKFIVQFKWNTNIKSRIFYSF